MSSCSFCQLDELKHIYEGFPDFLEHVFYLFILCVNAGKWKVHFHVFRLGIYWIRFYFRAFKLLSTLH